MGNADDVLQLMQRERGLMWTAHARVKGSFGFPDVYRKSAYFLSDRFLGAAWKAMPSDLSHDRLGTRVLDLESDMSNWGDRKYALGEVDVFRVREDYELYGNMNINYVKLEAVPKYADGWEPVLTSLREGRFFVTTGEITLADVTLAGAQSGETIPPPGPGRADLARADLARAAVAQGNTAQANLARADLAKQRLAGELRWTFPLAFAEVVSGDGTKVYRQRIDLSATRGFGVMTLDRPVDLAGRTWARLEVVDVAGNTAFTQPVWIGQTPK